MDNSILVRLFGFPATLIHGDPLVLDRWTWLRDRLPPTTGAERVLDVGCGSGAFTIGATRRGYRGLGLSWDQRNQAVASERAKLCGAEAADFEVFDVRSLDTRPDLEGQFEAIICTENIEHILDDRRLMKAMAGCLKPGGRLLLTTPNLYLRPIGNGDEQELYADVEDGRHVRRGYTQSQLVELARVAGLEVDEIGFVGGFLSQKLTGLQSFLGRHVHPWSGWAAVLPLRVLPPLFDDWVTRRLKWPGYSICGVFQKPRFA